ncbi:hypothetical protein DITRI_Ditri04bG0080700 [Diplodiscus trichospermus]
MNNAPRSSILPRAFNSSSTFYKFFPPRKASIVVQRQLTMDAFSSSFLPTIAPSIYRSPAIITKPRSTSTPPYAPHLYILSVRIEENPPTSYTPRTTTTKTPPQILKTQPPPPLPKEKASPHAVAGKKRVEPKLSTLTFNTFDDIINNFMDPPIRPSVDPRHVLSNNFAHVDELVIVLVDFKTKFQLVNVESIILTIVQFY